MNLESNLNGNPHVEFRKTSLMPNAGRLPDAMRLPVSPGLIESENSMKLAPAVVPS